MLRLPAPCSSYSYLLLGVLYGSCLSSLEFSVFETFHAIIHLLLIPSDLGSTSCCSQPSIDFVQFLHHLCVHRFFIVHHPSVILLSTGSDPITRERFQTDRAEMAPGEYLCLAYLFPVRAIPTCFSVFCMALAFPPSSLAFSRPSMQLSISS